MLTKEQRDEILRLAYMMLSQRHRASDKLVAYIDSITVPEGWQMVPVEPTSAMVVAGLEHGGIAAGLAYADMLAAAPKPGDSNE